MKPCHCNDMFALVVHGTVYSDGNAIYLKMAIKETDKKLTIVEEPIEHCPYCGRFVTKDSISQMCKFE